MAFARNAYISGRERRRKVSVKNLMHETVQSKIGGLKQIFVAVIGDEETGRHTLLRRFRDMNGEPFRRPESSENRRRRYILIALIDRPYVVGTEMICMHTTIFNFQELELGRTFEIIRRLDSLVVIFDVGRDSTYEKAVEGMEKITDVLGSRTPGFILVANKIDLPQREVLIERGRAAAEFCKAARYYECSALMNENMDPILDAVLIMGLNQFVPLPL